VRNRYTARAGHHAGAAMLAAGARRPAPVARAPTVCATPGCGEIVKSGKCDSCRATERRKRRSSNTYDARWRRRRREYLHTHKLCECEACLRLPEAARPAATDVHHVDGAVTGQRESDEQLRSYAHGHHSRETAKMQPGGFHSRAARDRLIRGRVVDAHNPDRSSRRTGQ
jgi:5-methylcytosine-specific restriction protein A